MQTPSAWGRSCGSTARDFAPFKGDLPAIAGDGTSKSAASRRFVALSAERMAERMASDLSKLDLLVIADLQMRSFPGGKLTNISMLTPQEKPIERHVRRYP
jgi:hypothetical protein